jgi:aspartate aminotransferase
MSDYERKRVVLCDNLAAMGYQFVRPQGAFYLFPQTPIEDDVAFVKALQDERILTVPGSGFGTPGYFRISYCVENQTIEGSLDGFRKVAKAYGLSQ